MLVDILALPERAFGLIEQLCVQLLPANARAFVKAGDVIEKRVREVRAVLIGRAARDDRSRIGHQRAEHLDRLRSRGDDRPRIIAESQPELQVIPRLFQESPRSQLIGPCEVKLRAAE